MSVQPQTDDEWRIHSLNIHGVFFERWCQQAITMAPGWRVSATNYPVEFPPATGAGRSNESALDIRADSMVGAAPISLLLECKKNNPDFVDWVFFPRPGASRGFFFRHCIRLVALHPPGPGWAVRTEVEQRSADLLVATEARETRGTYQGKQRGDLTKTSNAAIADAAYQIALATQAIITEEAVSAAAPTQTVFSSGDKRYYIPTIVTTARLFSVAFDPKDIAATTGEIPLTKAQLARQPYLLYEYPLPRSLQRRPDNGVSLSKNEMKSYMYLHILVVQSTELVETLGKIPTLLFGERAR